MLGAIAGDIIGSYWKFKYSKRYKFPLFKRKSQFTDETVMTLAVAKWLLDSYNHSSEDLMKEIRGLGKKYPNKGYDGLFLDWWFLDLDSIEPYKSWGNGSAMRVSPVGLYAKTIEEVLYLAERSAIVSHNHPEGIKGAQSVALSVFLAKKGVPKNKIKEEITNRFGYDLNRKIDQIRSNYEWDASCQGSVPESILAFLEGKDFEDVVRLAISLGGDADTMACIAGSIAACVYPIPERIKKECENRLTPDLLEIMNRFENHIMKDN